jgi:hypothetical protein
MSQGNHAVLVGPIRGTVTLEDGTEVDVRPAVVYVDTLAQAHEVADKVGARYAREGHPDHDPGDGFNFDAELSRKNFQAAKDD